MMILNRLLGVFLCISLSLMYANFAAADGDYKNANGKIVIADRAAGTISIINVGTDRVSATIPLPAGDNPPEPMYVVHSPKADRVFVGDRANNRVVIFDDDDFDIEGSIAAGNGIFHMWADPGDNQLWVNNDIDNTATVIDPVTLETLATVEMPADLIASGGKPHDVILDPSGEFAYVTLVGFAGPSDYVVKFHTDTFTEVARAAVGKDPHVSLTSRNDLLYVPCQNSNAVFVLKRDDLSLLKTIPVPGTHGAGMPRKGKTFYTTNLPGSGSDGIFAIDTDRNEIIGAAVDTPFPVPHNIALTSRADKLYITHSGVTADQVSVYRINRKTKLPVFETTVTVGLNPFGLAFVR